MLPRIAFAAYALLLFAATHRPNLTLPIPGRKDLVFHATAFGLWAALLIVCGFFGPPLSRRNLLAVVAIAPLYAAFDEGSQAIPWIRRHAAWDDFLFNLIGIAAAVTLASLFGLIRRNQSTTSTTMLVSNPSPAARRDSAAS